jgi:hypothetical protein
MLPRFHSLFLALMMALLLVVGTIGIYTAEAAAFRSTIRDGEAIDQASATEGYDFATDVQPMPSVPGQLAY